MLRLTYKGLAESGHWDVVLGHLGIGSANALA